MRICMLIMRTPSSDEDSERLFGIARSEIGHDLSIFLLGDGVLCARKGQSGHAGSAAKAALNRKAVVRASARDLRARGVGEEELEPGVESVEDLEGAFVEEAMERAERVFAW